MKYSIVQHTTVQHIKVYCCDEFNGVLCECDDDTRRSRVKVGQLQGIIYLGRFQT